MISTMMDGATVLAYLDPGTGSMAIQVLIAGMLSSLFFFKSAMVQVKDRLARLRQGR